MVTMSKAKDRVGPAIEDARDMLMPAAQQAIAEGKRHGRKAAVKLRLAEEPKQGHSFRNMLLLLVLAGVGFVVYKKFFANEDLWAEADIGTANKP